MRRAYLLVILLFIPHVIGNEGAFLTLTDPLSFSHNNGSNKLRVVINKNQDLKIRESWKFRRDTKGKWHLDLKRLLNQLPRIKREVKNENPGIYKQLGRNYIESNVSKDCSQQSDVTDECQHNAQFESKLLKLQKKNNTNTSLNIPFYESPSRKKCLVPFPSMEISKEDTYIVFPGPNFVRLPIRAHKLPIELMKYYSKASGILNDYGYRLPELNNFKKGYHDWIFKNVLPEVNVHEYGFQDLSRVVRQIEGDYETEEVFLDSCDPLYFNDTAFQQAPGIEPFISWFQYPTQPLGNGVFNPNARLLFYLICVMIFCFIVLALYGIIPCLIECDYLKRCRAKGSNIQEQRAHKACVNWTCQIDNMNFKTLQAAQCDNTLQSKIEREVEMKIGKANTLRNNARKLISSLENDPDACPSDDLKNDKFFWTIVKLLMKEDLEEN